MNTCYFGVKYCDNCGEELEPYASICKKCGHLLKYQHSKMTKFKGSQRLKSLNPPSNLQKSSILTLVGVVLFTFGLFIGEYIRYRTSLYIFPCGHPIFYLLLIASILYSIGFFLTLIFSSEKGRVYFTIANGIIILIVVVAQIIKLQVFQISIPIMIIIIFSIEIIFSLLIIGGGNYALKNYNRSWIIFFAIILFYFGPIGSFSYACF